jgi:DNA-directed RNA polymerase specialized sigma subunit
VKDLSEVSLSPHDKEWLKRHAREQEWTVADLQEDLLKKTGQDVDPASIQEFINTTRNEWLSHTNESRTRGDRQATARSHNHHQGTPIKIGGAGNRTMENN